MLWKATANAGDKEPAVFTRLFGDGNLVRLVTVALVISAVAYLALADKLDQGGASLLSGVAGFVLGGMRIGAAKCQTSGLAKVEGE